MTPLLKGLGAKTEPETPRRIFSSFYQNSNNLFQNSINDFLGRIESDRIRYENHRVSPIESVIFAKILMIFHGSRILYNIASVISPNIQSLVLALMAATFSAK